jgi:hypothetical protein
MKTARPRENVVDGATAKAELGKDPAASQDGEIGHVMTLNTSLSLTV